MRAIIKSESTAIFTGFKVVEFRESKTGDIGTGFKSKLIFESVRCCEIPIIIFVGGQEIGALSQKGFIKKEIKK